ncbi:unnamed protein product [Paramecium sonneborni]|uniref:Uncharacterized protein n=1 Tax=Paramecium sonneborni TaxID=65129 RepID=A0A8S1P681_9CILI|nr:unnamed protein product [Paramecium sonneborni]
MMSYCYTIIYLSISVLQSKKESLKARMEKKSSRKFIFLKIQQEDQQQQVQNNRAIIKSNLKGVYIQQISWIDFAYFKQTAPSFKRSNRRNLEINSIVTEFIFPTTKEFIKLMSFKIYLEKDVQVQ